MIKLKYKNQCLVVNALGGGIAKYFNDDHGKHQDIIFGYRAEDEKAASMGDVLFPFPGRVANAEYNYEGQHYKLSGLRIKDGHAQHGFAKFAEWEIINKTGHSVTLQFKMTEAEYEAKGYPFSMNLRLEYYLNDDGMTCAAAVENFGAEEAPFGLGFHPYFTLGTDKIDELFLQLQAADFVEFDDKLKPTGQLLDIYYAPMAFWKKRRIGGEVIDNCFTNLVYKDDTAKTVLSNDAGASITLWQDENLPYIQLYSGEGLGEGRARRGLAIEPQTCCGYAFNLPDMGLKTLKPGERFEAKWGITPNII